MDILIGFDWSLIRVIARQRLLGYLLSVIEWFDKLQVNEDMICVP